MEVTEFQGTKENSSHGYKSVFSGGFGGRGWFLKRAVQNRGGENLPDDFSLIWAELG